MNLKCECGYKGDRKKFIKNACPKCGNTGIHIMCFMDGASITTDNPKIDILGEGIR
jgi:hypothetical protein